MRRRERTGSFREWLNQQVGFVPASWVHHLTGVSKAAISAAIGEGRVRVVRYTFPDGHQITLVSLHDGARLDVYRDGPGWVEDIDASEATPKQQARRAARMGRKAPEGSPTPRTRQKPATGE